MKSKLRFARLCLGALLVASALSGCAVSGGKLHGPSGTFKVLEPTQANEAVVVFLREDGAEGRVPLLLTNDRVVGSLLSGRYAQARVCAGSLMAGTADRDAVVGVPQYQAMNVQAGHAIYLQVLEGEAGKFQLKPLDEALARERLDKLQMASHIINRHVPDCSPKVVTAAATPAAVPAAMPAVPVVLKRLELGADALFKFDRFAVNDMLPEGRAELDKLVHEVRQSEVAVERVRLTGHTDRLGKAAYNMKLSQLRAETVAGYLRQAGLAMPIETKGMGEQEPVTTNCVGAKATPALVACLQPDRRVSVELVGVVQQQAASVKAN